MNYSETIKFNKLTDPNDISIVESVIFPIFSKKTLKQKQNWNQIRSLLLDVGKHAKIGTAKMKIFWWYVNRTISSGLKKGEPLKTVENKLRSFIRKTVKKNEKDINAITTNRAKINFKRIEEYIVGEKILDLGAGDGLLALEIKKKLNQDVLLVDVVDYNSTGLPLILYNPEEKLPLSDNQVDTTILYTVLHHSNDPEYLLKEATRVTKQRLIIKEAYIEKDDIRMTNSFVDWFYNRVIGDEDINVPLNFLKIKGWKQILNSFGFKIIKTEYLGIDEPLVPEHHMLIIADKIE